MNYRHAFHAGNFADVLKHAALALIIEHLKQKPKPFRVVDTHAGIGRYRLDAAEALRTSEWRHGIGRLFGPDAAPIPADVAALLAPYLDGLSALNHGTSLAVYPGSPLLALHLMRTDDRLLANELHPEDARELRRHVGRDPRARILDRDGWQVLKAALPPPERRAVILIDPPFEEADEFKRLEKAMDAAMTRFRNGIYMLWFPLKDISAARSLEAAAASLELDESLWLELAPGLAPDKPGGLAAAGLAILNPPYRFEDHMRVLLPFLAHRLARTADSPGTWACRQPRLASSEI